MHTHIYTIQILTYLHIGAQRIYRQCMCMYVGMHTNMRVRKHTDTYIRRQCTHAHAYQHTCTQTCLHICMPSGHIHMHMYPKTHAHNHTDTYIRHQGIHTCACIARHMHIIILTHIHAIRAYRCSRRRAIIRRAIGMKVVIMAT